MSKEQLEKAKTAIKNNYPDERYSELRDALDYVISEAETVRQFAKKNIELNEFLNDYSEAEHWGRSVIDVAMDIITKQDKQIEELKDDKIELYKLNAKFGVKAWDIEQQNKRYRDHLKYMLDEAKDHKKKRISIQHWALIKDLERALEGDSDE